MPGDLVLETSIAADVEVLMRWLDNESDVLAWGGPKFRYPFNRHSFSDDLYWGRMASFSLRDAGGELAAFGQVYERLGLIHFARLIADPARRSRGLGRALIAGLMPAGRALFPCDGYSLFVFKDNLRALRCYQSMGFSIEPYPGEIEFKDRCHYLTRPVDGA